MGDLGCRRRDDSHVWNLGDGIGNRRLAATGRRGRAGRGGGRLDRVLRLSRPASRPRRRKVARDESGEGSLRLRPAASGRSGEPGAGECRARGSRSTAPELLGDECGSRRRRPCCDRGGCETAGGSLRVRRWHRQPRAPGSRRRPRRRREHGPGNDGLRQHREGQRRRRLGARLPGPGRGGGERRHRSPLDARGAEEQVPRMGRDDRRP
jgi:hypothetical protein